MRVTCDFGLWRGEERRGHGTLGRRRGEDRRRDSLSSCKREVVDSSPSRRRPVTSSSFESDAALARREQDMLLSEEGYVRRGHDTLG
jgi:hypothetical protein